MSIVKGGMPGSLRTSGTREAGDKPPSISTPHSVSACSCQTTGVPCTDNLQQEKTLLCSPSEPFTLPHAERRSNAILYMNAGNSSHVAYSATSEYLLCDTHSITLIIQAAPIEGESV